MDRKEFLGLLGNRPYGEIQLIETAYWLAKREHSPQERDTGERYFEHPRAVDEILIGAGYSDTPYLIAGLLHDVFEDGFLPRGLIRTLFGNDIQQTIGHLTKVYVVRSESTDHIIARVKKPDDMYIENLRKDPIARVVKCADRLHNLRTCAIWEAPKISLYLEETERHVMPMAREFAPTIAGLMTAEILRLNEKLSEPHTGP
jgi:GTP pyrophosphokinase